MQRPTPDVIVHSWDFDGMLASHYYHEKLQELIIRAAEENRSLTMNDYADLADFIIEKYHDFFDKKFQGEYGSAQHVVCVGSDRQDRTTDSRNGALNFKGGKLTATLSCYPFYEALCGRLKEKYHVGINLEKMLLEDAYLGLKSGEIFEDEKQTFLSLPPELFKKMAECFKNPSDSLVANVSNELKDHFLKRRNIQSQAKELRYSDKQKFLIMYAQIHKLKNDYKNKGAIEFHFADDRRDILEAASRMIGGHGEVIPDDVTIRLEQFLPPDAEYRQMVKRGEQRHGEHMFGDFTVRVYRGLSESNTDDYDHNPQQVVSAVNSILNDKSDYLPGDKDELREYYARTVKEQRILVGIIRELRHDLNSPPLKDLKSDGLEQMRGILNKDLYNRDMADVLRQVKEVVAPKLESNVLRAKGRKQKLRAVKDLFGLNKKVVKEFYQKVNGINIESKLKDVNQSIPRRGEEASSPVSVLSRKNRARPGREDVPKAEQSPPDKKQVSTEGLPVAKPKARTSASGFFAPSVHSPDAAKAFMEFLVKMKDPKTHNINKHADSEKYVESDKSRIIHFYDRIHRLIINKDISSEQAARMFIAEFRRFYYPKHERHKAVPAEFQAAFKGEVIQHLLEKKEQSALTSKDLAIIADRMAEINKLGNPNQAPEHQKTL